jgi:hypothetical protein
MTVKKKDVDLVQKKKKKVVVVGLYVQRRIEGGDSDRWMRMMQQRLPPARG